MKSRLIGLTLLSVAMLGHMGPATARQCQSYTAEEAENRPEYESLKGCEVPVPIPNSPGPEGQCRKPPHATARCNDGDWSFSENHRGTCSHHRGVACWVSASTSCCDTEAF